MFREFLVGHLIDEEEFILRSQKQFAFDEKLDDHKAFWDFYKIEEKKEVLKKAFPNQCIESFLNYKEFMKSRWTPF